jgi:hypothetical protein
MEIFGLNIDEEDPLCDGFISYANDPSSASDETILAAVRFHRNHLLLNSDWTQIEDSTADKTAWAAYRQQLRDLPVEDVDPRTIVFPTPPE